MIPPITKQRRGKRTDGDYLIDAAAKCFDVFEALAQDSFQPVEVPVIAERCGHSYDFCRRALFTLKLRGWAVQTERGWQLSVKAGKFSSEYLAVISRFAN